MPYYAWTIPYAKEVRTLMDDLGLRCYSTHNRIPSFTPGDTMAKAIELNQVIGSRLLVLATAPEGTKGVEDWKKLSGQLTTAVEKLKPHGLSCGYHNHQTEWTPLEGGRRPWISLPPTRRRNSCCNWTSAPASRPVPIPSPGSRPIRVASRSRTSRTGHRAAPQMKKATASCLAKASRPGKKSSLALESVGGVEFYLLEQEDSRFSEFDAARRDLEAWKTLKGSG